MPGGRPGADPFEEIAHRLEPAAVGQRRIDHHGKAARAGRTHQRARRDQVGEIERGDRLCLGMLHHRRGADGEIRAVFLDRGNVLFQAGAVLHARAVRFEPFAIGIGPHRARRGGADIGHFGAAFDQQACDQQFRTFIARNGDPALDRPAGQRAGNRGQEPVLGRIDGGLGHAAGRADRIEPGGGAIAADRRRADDTAPGGFEFADAGGVERMDRGHRGAIERRIELSPFASRYHGAGGQAQRRQQHADARRIGGEHFAQQRNGRPIAAFARRGDGARFHFLARIGEHRAGQHVLGLGMGGHAETGHIDADHPHAVDLVGQQLQRHARGGGHAQIGDDDRIVERGIGQIVNRLADILEQLAGDERFGRKRHIADAAPRTVEVRSEGQAIDAAGRARQHRGRAAHAQADAQGPERRAHRLRLVMRTLGIIGGIAIEHAGLARLDRRGAQRVARGAAAFGSRCRVDPVAQAGWGGFHPVRPRRRSLRGWAWGRKFRRACPPGWPG